MRIYEVLWVDSTTLDGWMDISQAKELTPIPCKSVGYLVSRTGKCTNLTQSTGNGTRVNGTISIPKGCIVAVRKLPSLAH